MKLLIPAVAIFWAVSAPAFGQPLAAQEIDAAIEAGQTGKADQLVSRCHATAGFLDRIELDENFHPKAEHFHVAFYLTPWRIALLSADAKRLYKPYQRSQVPQMWRTLGAYVEAYPHDSRSPDIEHVVLKARNNVVQPEGVKNQDEGVFVRFPLAGTRELPSGDFDIVLITKAGERRCKVGAKDRARIFSGR
jgi:hypothetical protein